MKKVLLYIFISLLAMSLYAKPTAPATEVLPKQSVVIGVSMDGTYPIYHIVDLSTKELLAVCYEHNGTIRYLVHTGLIIDLEKQNEINLNKSP